MKTLFITNTYLRGNSGGVYATKAYINAFAQVSDSMTLIYAMKEGMEPQDILEDRITMIPVWDNRSQGRKFVDLCLGTVTRFQKKVFKLINPSDYDTVVFNNSDVSSGLIRKFKAMGLKTITIHHNYQIEYLKGDSSAITILPNLFWTYIYEGAAVRNSSLNLTLTREDIDLLQKHYGQARFDIIGVFEYKPFVERTLLEVVRGHKYVITGWLGSKQTEDSLIPWINNYYPLLKGVDPQAELTIAGRDPSESLCKLAEDNGIQIIPSPVDMQPILDAADYYICPTDRGGGLKLRNLDGLKSGLPVLTHVVSARGYEFMQNLGIVCSYDSESTFKEGVHKLLSCKKSRQRIISDYQGIYSFEAGVERLKDVIAGKQMIN